MPFAQRGYGASGGTRRTIGLALALAAATLPVAAAAQAGVVERHGGCGSVVETRPGELDAGDAERAVQCLVNRRREEVGAGPLRRNPTLTIAAQAHSAFMQQSACFEHLCTGEDPLDVRLSAAGYLVDGLRLWRYGEAIAWAGGDGGTPRGIVRRLMGSPLHKELLLDRTYDEMGVGFLYGTYRSSTEDGGLYTVELGRRAGVGDALGG